MPHADLAEVRLHYSLEGDKSLPVLTLSNSLGANLHMWAPQMPAFLEHFRVLRYDTRGHGQSGVPPGPYNIAQLGADVIGLLDHLGIERSHFCGLSMGGMVGIWLGVHAPERVEKLVLSNTAAHIGPPSLWDTRIDNVRKGGMEAIAPAVLERWFTLAFRERSPQAVERVRQALLAAPPEGYIASCAAVRDMDQRAAISGIRSPTLVIAATHDQSTPPEDGRFIADSIRGARYVEFDAAHLSNIEAQQRFSTEVMRFLRQ